VKAELQGSLLKVYFKNGKMPRPSKRGKIQTFSSKSRKRLLETTARLKQSTKAIFITLTYGQKFPSPIKAKKHLKAFMRVIKRLYPKASGFWRLEMQKRGAPHFHLICFNLPFWDYQEVNAIWGKIIGPGFWDTSDESPREPFTDIQLIRNHKQAMYYVSKYIAKKQAPESGVSLSMSHNGTQTPEIGRFWGTFNRICLPFAKLIEVFFTSYKALQSLEFYAAWESRYIKTKGRVQGFTLFTQNMQRWRKIVLEVLLDETTDYSLWTVPSQS